MEQVIILRVASVITCVQDDRDRIHLLLDSSNHSPSVHVHQGVFGSSVPYFVRCSRLIGPQNKDMLA